MGSSKLSRRRLLKGLGAATVAGGTLAYGGGAAVAEAIESGSLVVGAVQGSAQPHTLYLIGPGTLATPNASRRLMTVQTSKATAFSRGVYEEPTSLAAYAPGEMVIAEGAWVGEAFKATTVSSVYSSLEGTIAARHSDQLETSAGTLSLLVKTKVWDTAGKQLSPDALRIGDSFRATVWTNPATHQKMLVLVTRLS
jgi:hypothetical protein